YVAYEVVRSSEGNRTIDPLLLLAILAELSGKTEFQDAQIAALIDAETAKPFTDHVLYLLSGSLKVRAIAQQLLEKMAGVSKSDQLTEAVRKLLPERK